MTRLLSYPFIAHLTAMAAALYFAWHVSQTTLVTTGVQFVAPLLVVMAVHYLWLAFGRSLTPGYALKVFGRSAGSALLMIVLIFAGSVLAPQPAQADVGEAAAMVLTVLVCVLMIVAVIAVPSLIIWGIAKLIFSSKKDDSDPNDRLNDGASLIVVIALVGLASAEGVTERLSFDAAGSATAITIIDAPSDDVWAAMQTATAPEFPLPSVFAFFPRPTEVSTDEGSTLGAMRVVRFRGREGAGALTLQVVEHTDTRSVFQVQSDTTPYKGWIAQQSITYAVFKQGNQTRLETTLQFERKLSPAWFFGPVMSGVGKLSMGVLGRDVKARAEAL